MASDDFEYKKSTQWSKEIAVTNIKRYCAIQDRSHFEVRTKLLSHQVYGQHLEDIMADLVTEGFLDEERFAKSYARGKFRMKRWGRIKILNGLKNHRISTYCIREGLREIGDEEYFDTALNVVKSRIKNDRNILQNPQEKQKLIQFIFGKGYEYEIIEKVIQSLLSDGDQ